MYRRERVWEFCGWEFCGWMLCTLAWPWPCSSASAKTGTFLFSYSSSVLTQFGTPFIESAFTLRSTECRHTIEQYMKCLKENDYVAYVLQWMDVSYFPNEWMFHIFHWRISSFPETFSFFSEMRWWLENEGWRSREGSLQVVIRNFSTDLIVVGWDGPHWYLLTGVEAFCWLALGLTISRTFRSARTPFVFLHKYQPKHLCVFLAYW